LVADHDDEFGSKGDCSGRRGLRGRLCVARDPHSTNPAIMESMRCGDRYADGYRVGKSEK
jgi:hypothetical protein